MKQLNQKQKVLDVSDYIKAILIDEFKSVILEHKGSAYSKFLLIAVGIEYLGACLDDFAFNKPENSEKRFNRALKKLFSKKYHRFTKKSANVYLFEDFRCGFVHQLKPSKKIVLTHSHESKREGTKHLENIEDGPLVLVLEDFYSDFEKACYKLFRDFKDGKVTNKKNAEDFLVLTDIKENQ